MPRIRGMKALVIGAALLAVLWSWEAFSAKGEPFSFVHFSDVHVPTYLFAIGQPLDEATLLRMSNQRRLEQLVRECLAMDPKPAFVINSGDTGDVGWVALLKLYQRLMEPLVSAGIPVYTVVGNHDLDYTGIGVQDLAEIFDALGPAAIGRTGPRYSFDSRGCHFVLLNDRPVTGLIRLTPSDIAWLRNDLKRVKRETPVLIFLHAELPEQDTAEVVERLQPFKYPVIFQGHAHSEGMGRWGSVPVVVTGALYGGIPEAGSYRVVTIRGHEISVRTRDFADSAATAGPRTAVEFLEPGPRVRLITPGNSVVTGGTIAIKAETKPSRQGVMEYSIPGEVEWTPMRGGKGKWLAEAAAPGRPGWHPLVGRFKDGDGSIVMAHTVFRVPGRGVREAWTKDLGSAVQAAPVIWRDLAVVPTRDGGVYALRLASGRIAWHRRPEFGQMIGRVVSFGDSVFYGAGRVMCACSALTGKILWQTDLRGTLIAGLTIGEGRVYAPAGEHQLFCLDTRTGKIIWEYNTDLPIMMEPATDDGRVYLGAVDGCVRALDAASGKEIWKKRVSSLKDNYTTAPFWPPVLAGDKVIVSKRPVDGDENNLMALTASTGEGGWSARAAGAALRLALSPDGKRLYAPVRDGLQCLSAASGTLLWSRETGVGMCAAIASGDVVLIRDSYDVCCLDGATGRVLWTYRVSTGPQGTYYGPDAFAIRGDLAIVGSMDGRVIALEW